MSSYLLAVTNYLLPESSYLPRHTRSTVVSETCRNGVAKDDRNLRMNFGRLAKAEARDTTCLRTLPPGASAPGQVRRKRCCKQRNCLMISAKTRGVVMGKMDSDSWKRWGKTKASESQ